MARKPTTPRNAVLFHHPDAVDTGRAWLMGRHAAGEGFLNGFVRHSGVDQFYAHTLNREHFDDFARRVGAADPRNRPCHWVPVGDMAAAEPATLMVTDPALAPFAWRRRATGGRGYSLCGMTHTLASTAAMNAIGELLTAPMQPWDAFVCTSETAKATVLRVLDQWGYYLSQRSGGEVASPVQLPVIPLGVDCDAYQRDGKADAERRTIRQGLGIKDDDIAVLFMGRLSFHAKAHPTPLYLALEEAARRCTKRLHLIQAGWFANETIEREIRYGVRAHAPSVNPVFLDGREPEVRHKVWFAADIFTSLSDNIQESFGLTPIEAMAAALPVVVSDWDGYRDTVRPGLDGFTVPTWMPLPGAGGDLALAPESAITDAAAESALDLQLGHVSQFTAVDVAAAADAFATLADDDDLRRQMGEAGRRHAVDDFDWSVVVGAYQALWRELENIRNREAEIAPVARDRPARPLRDDPFTVFEAYPTGTIDGDTKVTLTPVRDEVADDKDWRRRLDDISKQAMNVFAAGAMLDDRDLETLLRKLDKDGPLDVLALAELLPEERRFLVARTTAWLAKMGIVRLEAVKGRRRKGAAAGAGGGPAQALVDLGVAARRQGAFDVALSYFKRALKNHPDDPVANNQMGELMAAAGALDEAKSGFKRALEASVDYHPAARNLGRVLFLDGDFDAAAEALQRAGDLDPKDAETKFLLGVCWRYGGNAAMARRHLEAALDLDPGRLDGIAHLGLVRAADDEPEAARGLFEKVLAKDPGHVLATAAMMNLDADGDGGARKSGAKRVGLYVHAKYHLAHLRPLFEALGADQRPHISADLRDLADFGPDVTVLCDAPVGRVRALMPETTTVNVRKGLAGRNFIGPASRHADYTCIPGEMVLDEIAATGALPAERLWITGYAPMDPMFRGDPLPRLTPDDGRRMVLYAPTHHSALSSAPMLGERAAALIGGSRDDLSIVIKPHPLIAEYRPGWMAAWGRVAARDPHVHLIRDPALDITPLLMAADVLVSDASGVIFQYLALDRPVVLVTNPEHARDTEHYDANFIEWRWRDLGEEVTDTAGLADAVARALADPDERGDVRRRYARLLFDRLTDGGAVGRIAEKIAAL